MTGEVVVHLVVDHEVDHVAIEHLRFVAVRLLDDARAPAVVGPAVEDAATHELLAACAARLQRRLVRLGRQPEAALAQGGRQVGPSGPSF